jgi:hypothetical protein
MSGNGNGSYAKLVDEAEPVYSTAGLTTAEAAEAQKKWGKNEIPEEKEPVRSSEARATLQACPLAYHRSTHSPPHIAPVALALILVVVCACVCA